MFENDIFRKVRDMSRLIMYAAASVTAAQILFYELPLLFHTFHIKRTASIETFSSKKPALRPNKQKAMIEPLKKIFASEGVPEQLVWIAEIESGFNPSARSARGAAGLFQMKEETAARYGLKTGIGDQRFAPEHSARAAARHLRELYEKFGSWPLALAAYNAGEYRVEKALAASGGKTLKSANKFLPVQTRFYVPKVIALIRNKEGVHPAALPPPSSFTSDKT